MPQQSPTDLMNEWIISDPIRVKAWQRVADQCLATARALQPAGKTGEVAAWLLSTALCVRYETAPHEAGLAALGDVEWDAIASAFLLGLSNP